jgi:Asp-tRNA(Asn)/Glu-tRNA(Gln) amidotransferase C subunit
MATTSRLKLTRDQLASFLQDHEQIRQFERLFSQVEELEPTTLADIILNLAVGDVKAGEALDAIEALRRDMVTAESQTAALLESMQKQIDGLLSAPPPREFKRARYGQFLDTTTQIAAAINTPYAITFNTTDVSRGVYLGSPTSRVYVDTEGIYNFLFSIQIDKTSGGTAIFWVWPRINGVDVPDSNSQVQIQGNNAEQLVTIGYFFELKPNDYVEIMYAVSDVSVQVEAFPASAFHPSIPSIILTVSNNIQGVQ